MTDYTREQIRANRQKWASFLQEPERKKARLVLDDGNDCRCCLGHACFVLGIKRERSITMGTTGVWTYGENAHDQSAPYEAVDALGLYSSLGESRSKNIIGDTSVWSLTGLNDDARWSPQQIGKYLQSVIEGGEDTPFRPLSEYPSADENPRRKK